MLRLIELCVIYLFSFEMLIRNLLVLILFKDINCDKLLSALGKTGAPQNYQWKNWGKKNLLSKITENKYSFPSFDYGIMVAKFITDLFND